jgi:hypothetical protein
MRGSMGGVPDYDLSGGALRGNRGLPLVFRRLTKFKLMVSVNWVDCGGIVHWIYDAG